MKHSVIVKKNEEGIVFQALDDATLKAIVTDGCNKAGLEVQPGQVRVVFHSAHVSFEWAFAVDATIYVETHDDHKTLGYHDEEGSAQRTRFEVMVGWSSCNRTLAQANAAALLYGKCLNAAAIIEMLLGEYNAVWYPKQ